MEQLKAILQKEPTIMSVIVRAILLGTTGIFCLLPLLKLLSPEIINLGQIVKREYLWAIIIFVFPFSFLLFWKVRRHFKLVKKMKRRLWAYILLQLKDNVDSIISNEVNGFYDDVIHYCNEKADDFERLRNSMYVTFEIQSDRYLTTFFNRPLDEFISDKTLLKENIDVGVLISVDEMKEEHLYMLLNNCTKKIGYEVLDVIPSGNEELKKHVTDYIHRLFNEILQSLQEPVEANELIKAWLYSKDGISELGKCLGKAYPVGLFVDNFTDSIYNNCRINHILFDTERFDGIDWLSDSYVDSNLLFITRSLGMDSLVLSRILNNYMDVNIEFPITTQVELACYYAYYSTNDKECAYFRNMLISSARLNTIHNELTN